MIGRIAPISLLALALGTGSPAEAQGPSPSIRWEADPSGKAPAVSVVGLPPGSSDGPAGGWSEVFAITVDLGRPDGPSRPAMLGKYRLEGDALRFTPAYPLRPGTRYVATFRPAKLPGATSGLPEIVAVHLVPKPSRPATRVTRVAPSGDVLPENLLKFYLHFSSPMGRGEAYERVQLLGPGGRAVDLPFLRLGEELWDPTGTRLTMLIDPGRIKRGLKPREENGPVLEAGKSYTLVVDPAWRDAEGDPLGQGFRKVFQAGPADESQPDPTTWTVAEPSASTLDPLTLTFPEALDRALIDTALTLVDAQGREVAGTLAIPDGERGWRFTPEHPWVAGSYQVVIDADLEDLAGNSIRRPFEVDVQRDTPTKPETQVFRLPVAIRPAIPGPAR